MDNTKDVARQRLMESKNGAMYVFVSENRNLINFEGVAEKYLERTGEWMKKRIRPYEVDGKMMQLKFTEEEFAMLASAFKDMANRLKETADAIEKGRMC